MIGEAALNGLFQWLPQGLSDVGKWGLGHIWKGGSEKGPKKRKKVEEDEEIRVEKRNKNCTSFSLTHKLVLEQSGSSFICTPPPRLGMEVVEDSTRESHPILSFSIGISSQKTFSNPLAKLASTTIQYETHPGIVNNAGVKYVSPLMRLDQPHQVQAAATTTDFIDPNESLIDDSDDDEVVSAAVTSVNRADQPPLEALKSQLKTLLEKGPTVITCQDQSTMAQLCEAIERHPAYSAADHAAMWTLRQLAKSFADIIQLRNSSQGLAEANAKYVRARVELRANKAKAQDSKVQIEQHQRAAEKLSSEAACLRLQLADTEAKLKELEKEVKVGKERDAVLLHNILAISNTCKKAGIERGRLQREDRDLSKKLAEANAAVTFLHSWLSF